MTKFKLLALFVFLSVNFAFADSKPIAIDSRIKTFIYSENEVFRLVIHYGYQTSIEFADGEEIQTISVGNNYAWQLTPVGRRLFIKPLEENILTNMTIITNKRVYQLEVQSKLLSYTIDEELVYVVRFFYPSEDFDLNRPNIITTNKQEPIPTVKPFNFNYTLTGSETLAPVKIFDDGINTFFKFDKNLQMLPVFSIKDGEKITELEPRIKGEYIIINKIAQNMDITLGKEVVTVYNEDLVGSAK